MDGEKAVTKAKITRSYDLFGKSEAADSVGISSKRLEV